MFKFKGCRHIMPTGRRCHCPALRGLVYCFSHQKLHVALNRSKYSHNRLKLAPVESPQGIQRAITQVCDALGKARIDERKAGIMMRGLQLATQLSRMSSNTHPSHVVQAHSSTLTASSRPPNHRSGPPLKEGRQSSIRRRLGESAECSSDHVV